MSRQTERAPKRDPGPVVTYSWPAPPPQRWQARLWCNLGLFAVVTVLLTVWFTVHFKPWLDKALVIVGPLSAFAVWKVVQSAFNRDFGGPSKKALDRLLRRPVATDALVGALLMSLVLCATTSSVYVVRAGATGSQAVRVKVSEDGNPERLADLEVTASHPLAGRPYLLRTRSSSLTFEVTEPRGYMPLPKPFRPWSAIQLSVPESFERDSFPLLRLIPGEGLIGELPDPNERQPAVKFDLELRWGTRRWPVPDVRNQGLYVGASDDDLRRAVGNLDATPLHAKLVAYLVRIEIPSSQPAHDSNLVFWETYRRVGTPRFRRGDKIQVHIRRQQDNQQEPGFARCELTVSDEQPVQTVFLRNEGDCASS